MQAEFHGEVGDVLVIEFGMRQLCPGFFGEIGIEFFENRIISSKIILVLRGLIQTCTSDLVQKTDRVMTEAFPQVVIEAAKETRRFGLPGPPQVKGQLAEA